MEGSRRWLVVTLMLRSETVDQHVVRYETGRNPGLSVSGLCTLPHQIRNQWTNHLRCAFIGVYRDSEKVMNSLRPFQQSNLRYDTINSTTLRDIDEADLGVFERYKEAV